MIIYYKIDLQGNRPEHNIWEPAQYGTNKNLIWTNNLWIPLFTEYTNHDGRSVDNVGKNDGGSKDNVDNKQSYEK